MSDIFVYFASWSIDINTCTELNSEDGIDGQRPSKGSSVPVTTMNLHRFQYKVRFATCIHSFDLIQP